MELVDNGSSSSTHSSFTSIGSGSAFTNTRSVIFIWNMLYLEITPHKTTVELNSGKKIKQKTAKKKENAQPNYIKEKLHLYKEWREGGRFVLY